MTKKRVALTPEQRDRFRQAARRVYNATAGDLWGESIPSDAEFVDVIGDLMTRTSSGLSQDEQELWQALSAVQCRKIILEVGP